ncbi:hypothetical protein NHQ30_008123 [Ciborinia camelliae]|nr:hypothetical protein NHQ30_008123 [Ciborinia camelliae]
MSPTLKTVTTLEEFSLVIDCMWEAYSSPYNPFVALLFPPKAPTAEGLAAAVQESKERFWGVHQEEKNSVWIYIIDEDENKNGEKKVLAAANWLFYEVSPFGAEGESGGKEEKGDEKADYGPASWLPEGEGREFAKKIFTQVFGFRAARMTRPHAQLAMIFTHTTERSRGYGSLLMEYGMSKIAEMNVEAVVEASESGLPLYEKFGFRVIEEVTIDTTTENPGFIWRKLEHEVRGKTSWWMWKPKPSDGIYEKGMELPWEKRG